jgi:hypothetical protein
MSSEMRSNTKTRRQSVLALAVIGLVFLFASAAQAATFHVTTTADNGDNANPTVGSLRKAIKDANASAGGDTIDFNIAGAGLHTISPLSPLPAITDPVVIDGYTQPGASANTLAVGNNAVLFIELDGTATGTGFDSVGLELQAGQTTIRGLVINRFSNQGILIDSGNPGGNKIEGCFIGTDSTGNISLPNFFGVSINKSDNNTIGGTSPAARNLISGSENAGNNIYIGGDSSKPVSGNMIQGNYIGTNAAGTAILSTNGSFTIEFASNTTIGGTSAGARNIISGNQSGIYLASTNSTLIQGNYIGTDATGTIALGNTQDGVRLFNSSGNTIGGSAAGARNLIAGNANHFGIELDGDSSTGNVIQGNYIGTNVTGNAALGNGSGIGLAHKSPSNNKIGGTSPGEGNLVSGNLSVGISIDGIAPTNNIIQGNLVGTNAAGTAALPNGDPVKGGGGIYLSATAVTNLVGGTSAGARNIISGNNAAGISLDSAQNQLIQGNYIGLDVNGATLGNGGAGIITFNSAQNNVIGGTGAGTGNIIAFNGEGGIVTVGVNDVGNAINGNAIYANADLSNQSSGLGIDLGGDNVTQNDAGDGDTGPNNLQNFPVITSATSSGGTTTITGILNSTANKQFRLEFFASAQCDPSGYGEGQIYLGATSVTTSGNNASFNVTLPATVQSGWVVTATATDPAGNTSEFSQCLILGGLPGLGTLQFSAPYSVNENGGQATITVTRTTGSTGAVSVQYATNASVAEVGKDYTPVAGTLNWATGDQSSKTFTVPVVNDALDEDDETIDLSLSSPGGGATIGTQNTAVLTIVDDDPTPSISVSDVSVQEGNSGTTPAVFKLTLSAPSGRSLSVQYQTADGTAAAGSDYQPLITNIVNFSPGETTKNITVFVNGDTTSEPDETFFLQLLNPTNVTLNKAQGTCTIQNDDAAPQTPTLAFSAASYSVNENGGQATITVQRTGTTTGGVSVQYATAPGGTATAGSDYTTTSGTLNWADNDPSNKTFTIPITDDSTNELNETVNLALSNPTNGAQLGSQATAVLTIIDDDAPLPTISIADVSQAEGNSGLTPFVFNVTLSAASNQTITVDFATTSNGGTTISGSDYSPIGGTLIFAPGQVSKPLTVNVNGDTTLEPDETFFMKLSNPTNATISKSQATGTIINDDVAQPSVLQLSGTTYFINEFANQATITVKRLGGNSGAVSVQYATAPGGTATAGSDYVSTSGTLNWADGDSSDKTFIVPITDDQITEPDETINLALSNPTGNAQLGSPITAVLTILDNDAPPPPTMQFEQADYSVNEGDHFKLINVTRTGDTSGAASVDYQTQDSTAQQRTDYNLLLGTLTFAPGETSKTLTLLVTDDSYVEGDETLTLILSNPVGVTLGAPSVAQITITDNDSNPTAANAIDDVPNFVRQHYHDFLNREPEPSGFQGWQDVLNKCAPGDTNCDRIEVSSDFYRSQEFHDRGYFIYRFYSASLGRIPHYQEFMRDMQKVSGFLSVPEEEAAKVAFIQEFMNRTEFKQKYDAIVDAGQYVDALSQTAGVTLANRDQLVQQLQSNQLTRGQALRAMIESGEVSQKFDNEAFVIMQYFGYLRRDADILYLNWLVTLNQTHDYRLMVNGFMNSLEYRQRFGQ